MAGTRLSLITFLAIIYAIVIRFSMSSVKFTFIPLYDSVKNFNKSLYIYNFLKIIYA